MFSKSFTFLAALYSDLHKARTPLAVAALAALAAPNTLRGHGFEGDYFFPPTIQTDDPFATDELSLPMVTTFNNPPGGGSPKTRETDISAEFDKEIFPKFALGISDAYTFLNPKGGPSIAGYDNITLSAKYQLWEVPAHQFIFSVGMEWEVGGSGKPSLTNNYSTLTPTIYFGKGFGDLPDSARFFKPFAVTGTVGEDVPVRSLDPNVLEWGIAIEYSIPYLEEHVKDIGLPHPFREMIPLVEFAMTSQENRGGGLTTGTVNPGVLWEGKYCQIGAEAVIPLTRAAGPNVGIVFNVQIWIDDLFPQIFGFPVFGRSQENTSIPHP